jgi:hypothetical protein
MSDYRFWMISVYQPYPTTKNTISTPSIMTKNRKHTITLEKTKILTTPIYSQPCALFGVILVGVIFGVNQTNRHTKNNFLFSDPK